jgi:hypothetical protein
MEQRFGMLNSLIKNKPGSGRLWQNRYFPCPVDKEEYLWAVAEYIGPK